MRKLTPESTFITWASRLTTVLGLAFDNRDRMYVLESMTAPGFPSPAGLGSGRVAQVDPQSNWTASGASRRRAALLQSL